MKFLKFLNERFEEIVLVTIFAVMVILVFLQVCMRYIFQSSLSWSEELSRYLFLWIIWLGSAYAAKKNSHISLDFIVRRLPLKGQQVSSFLKYFIWISFTIFLGYISLKLTYIIFERGQLSPALRMPMGYAYASIPFGVILMLFRIIQNLTKTFKSLTKTVKGRRSID